MDALHPKLWRQLRQLHLLSKLKDSSNDIMQAPTDSVLLFSQGGRDTAAVRLFGYRQRILVPVHASAGLVPSLSEPNHSRP